MAENKGLSKTISELVTGVWESAKGLAGGVVVLAALIAAIYGVPSYIDDQIERKILDPVFMKQVRENIGPSVIFDSRNRILADLGGMKFLKENGIQVFSSDKVELPSRIVVSPKEFLPIAPLLTSLDADRVDIKAERGENFDWVYTLTSKALFGDKLETIRFRLEILR